MTVGEAMSESEREQALRTEGAVAISIRLGWPMKINLILCYSVRYTMLTIDSLSV